ncbi:hypothetical protein HOC35_05995 [Candidatus Woesearchaeota archaeon]|jgi:hypothetical protein|nr:hypothetical protein [Candidatus Woesearchaeota archaeon]
MKKTNYQKLSLIVVSFVFIALLFGLAMANDGFVGKATLAIQGYSVVNVADEDLDEFEACLENAGFVYPLSKYQNQDKYCACKIKGYEGCDIYIGNFGKYKAGYLPDTQQCGDPDLDSRRDNVYRKYQYPDGSTSRLFVFHQCDTRCLQEENNCQENLCKESDDGYNVYEFGEVSGQNADFLAFKSEDTCIGNNQLKEYFCDKKGILKSRVEMCENGCVLGACRQEPCVDTDNGKKPFKLGTVTGSTTGEYNVKTVNTDTCEDSNTLREYFCGPGVGYTKIECESGCLGGRCT